MSWLSIGIPPDCLFDIIRMADFVRKLDVDLEECEGRICDENWRGNTTGNTCSTHVILRREREFDQNGSPDGDILIRVHSH